MWSDWGAWWLVFPLIAWEALRFLRHWPGKPDWGSVKFRLVMTTINVVAIGGFALLLASWFAGQTAKWSTAPAVRAAAGALVAAGVLTLSAHGTRKAAEPRAPKDSDDPTH